MNQIISTVGRYLKLFFTTVACGLHRSQFLVYCGLFLVLLNSSVALAAEYDLVLNQTDSPDPVIAGGVVTYNLRVTNDGFINSISNIQLTDTLPAGVVFVDATPSQGICSPPAGSLLTCNLGTLAPQDEATIAVRVRTTVSGIITNTASVTSTTVGFTDPDLSNNSQNEVTTVNAGANLSLIKTANPSPSVQSGATLVYTLTVNNAGPDTATNVRVVDNLPAGFLRTGALPGGCSQAGQVVTCDIAGSIASGGNNVIGPINGTVTAASSSTLTNSASATITSGAAPQDPDMSNNTAVLNTNVTAGCDLALTKTQSVANPIIQGNSFNYVLSITSTGDNPSNITVTDAVPANFTLGVPSGTGWSCLVAAQTVTCTRAFGVGAGSQTLPAITIPVTASTLGSGIINTATITSSTSDPVPGNNSGSVSTNVLAPNADLRMNKSARRSDGTALAPLLVQQGIPFLYRLSVSNLGPANVTSSGTLTITDTLPANITATSYAVTNGWSCTVLPQTGPAAITCTLSTNLASGATSPVVDINVTATNIGSITNLACVAGTGIPSDGNPANDCASAAVTSQNNPTDLRVVKTASPNPVNAGEVLTYAIEVVNSSTVPATTVSLTDTLTGLTNGNKGATGAGFIAAVVTNNAAAGGSCTDSNASGSSRSLSCSFTSIPQCTQGIDCPVVTVTVRPRSSGNRTNSAYAVSADVVDSNITDNTGSVTSSVNPIADVRTTITDTPDPLAVGTNLTYVGTIINQGPSDAANGIISITLPVGVAFISASPSAGSCSTTPGASGTVTTAGNQTVTCNLGTITLLGGQRTVTVIVRPTLAVSAFFPVIITAQSVVSTSTPESDVTNNAATTTTQVTNPGHDLLINKTDSPDPVAVGDDVTYTITAINNGPSYATAVQIVDTLPSTRFVYKSVTNAYGTCSGPILNVLTCDVGDLTSTQSKTITVVMTGTQKGVDTNNAAVSSAETRAGYPDTLPGNNSVSENTTVRTKVDIQVVSKTAAPNPAGLRRPFNWTISILNPTGAGLAEADNVVVSDTLPAGMELTGTPSVAVTLGTFSSTTCTGIAGQTSFTCDLGTVSSGATGTITVPVRVIIFPAGGTTSNSASIATSSRDINNANNTISGTVTILASGISGTVYRDLNDDGFQAGAGETGISGITITLNGTAFDASVIARTSITDGSGNFSFTGLPEGTYSLTEGAVVLAGFVDGRETAGTIDGLPVGNTSVNDVISGITLGENKNGINYLFGETPGVTISGSVLNDTDASHTSNAGDTPISGVTVTLTGTNDRGQAVSCSLSTNAGGSFSFTAVNCANLRAGNATGYTLTETQPAGYLPGYTLVGTATGIGSSPGTLSGGVTGNTISGILLPPGGTSTNNIFLEVRPATIGGSVYFDLNGNAIKEAGETVGVPGVTIVLSGTNDLSQIVSCTIITGAGGAYQFPNAADADPLCQTLRPGTYILTETKPAGLTSTGAQPGTPVNGTAGSTAFTQTISSIVITGAGNALTNYNFGHQGTALGGYVYVDINNNGVRDAGEPGIPGVAVTISGTAAASGSVCSYLSSCTVTTDANGSYSFASLPGSDAAGYTITERDGIGVASPVLSNYANGQTSRGTVAGILTGIAGNDVITGIVIATGQVGADYRFGELGTSLTGRVYFDVNNNGTYDGGDTGINAVTISLSGTTASGAALCTIYPSCITTTDGAGIFSFTGLPSGNYTITENQPVDYADGTTTAGTAGGSVTGTTITGIALGVGPGSNATGYLFGEKAGSITGFVYHDANNDGIKDAGEPGISGVTLTLSGNIKSGASVCTTIPSCTTTTAADGSYSFSGLRNADVSGYTITETQPAGYLDGHETAGTQGGTVDNTGFDNTAAKNRISVIPFSAAAVATGYNFGEVLSGSISGRVYHDFNNNGSYDAGEELAGVTITLTGNDDQGTAVNQSTITAADGSYSFSNLRPSNGAGYILTETQPAGVADFPGNSGTQVGTIGGIPTGTAALNLISGIVLNSGAGGINYNFRENASSLSGFVYLDTNNNGTKDGGETGIPGVTVTLSGSANRTAITAADGSYQFIGLTSGTYTLTETQPVIYQDGRETAGTAGGTVDNSSFTSNPAQNSISTIALPAGTAGSGYLFGERTGLPGSFSGKIWYNSITRDQTQQPGEPGMAGWRVDVKRGGVVQGSAVTAADGTWIVSGLAAGAGYEIIFRHPTNNALYGTPVSQNPGYVDSAPDYSVKTIANMVLRSGGNVIDLNLPIDPSGVVYDSITRLPVAGATVAIAGPPGFNAATQLAGGAANQIQVTNVTGFYQFLLLAGAPAGVYTINVTAPAGYIPGPSAIIPPTAGPYVVPGGPPVAIQAQPIPPTGAQPTIYYFTFTLSGASANVVNNHIPVDPILGGAIIAMKTTPLVNVKRGDLVPYTITMTNTLAATIPNIDVRDLMPPGFKYRTGSGTLNGVRIEPLITGRELTWRNLTFTAGEKKTFMMILVVGSGVAEGEYINQAYAANNIANTAVSNIATATVRIVPDPTFDCSDVIGKVFDDKNNNGYQDEGEPGIANVRLATARGLIVTTDAEGRFHIPCPEVPNADRGSNFIMKVDERTLPSGYRLTTENPLVVRLTRGKMTKINFGATIHRVIRIDVNGAAFERDDTKLREEWRQKIQALEKQLQEKSSVVRIAYRMSAEPKKLVDGRIKAIREMLQELWKKGKDCPPLVFEEEIVEVR